MATPLISVIMPVYNAAQYLAESMESILAQTYDNFEFLVFNDGSKDNSLSIIQQYASRDPRIKVFDSKENKGYLVHLNEGLRVAQGEYIARMDSDDISVTTRFEKQVALLSSENADIVGSNVIFFSKDKESGKKSKQALYHREALIQMIFSCPVYHPTVMFRKTIVANGDYYYDQHYYPAEDYELWSRLLPKYSFRNIEEPLVFYRESEGQISQQRKTVQRDHAFDARCNYVERLCSITLTSEEKQVFKSLFYDSYTPFTPGQMNTLFHIIDRIISGLDDKEDRVTFCKYLLQNLSYLSNRRNKFYRLYFKHGLDQYYQGTLNDRFNATVRQLFK